MADIPAHVPDLEPYRRRVAEIMRRPAQTIAEDARGALLVTNRFDQVVGILTERDITRALGKHAAAALGLSAGDIMTREVVAINESAFMFRAIGRMRRMNLRYLPVTDDAGRYTGMVSARALLALRALDGQVIADELDVAQTAEELGHARAALPQLATHLLPIEFCFEANQNSDTTKAISEPCAAM